MSKVRQILQEARNLIAAGWTKGTFARNADGQAVPNDSKSAQCFCTIGAIRRVADHGSEPLGPYLEAVVAVRQAAGTRNIPSWNDNSNRTKEEVLEAFDKAIKSVK